MTEPVNYADVQPGTRLPTRTFTVGRADLIRYAGASLDFNTIHWSERAARAAGLPNVIAHGALTMALALRALTDWAGDPAAVRDYRARFSKPVVVPDDGEPARVRVDAVVAEKLDSPRVRLTVTASCGADKVLVMPRVLVALKE